MQTDTKILTVGDIRKAIIDLPDEMPIVLFSHCCAPVAERFEIREHHFFRPAENFWEAIETGENTGETWTEPSLVIEGLS